MLQLFGENIWLADGAAVDVAGFKYPTRMAVIRLSREELFVWSPIALTKDLRAAVDALGTVRHLVAPNALHHLYLAQWQQAYPGAKLYAPPGLRAHRKDLVFDGDVDGGATAPPWYDEIDQVAVGGNRITTEIVFFHRKSRTVLFTDLIQHFEPGWFTGWRAVIARLDLMTVREPQVPRKFRFTFTDRAAARAAIRRILAWPAQKVVMAHAEPVAHGGQDFLARTFAWLKP